jgi:hypothetical protein
VLIMANHWNHNIQRILTITPPGEGSFDLNAALQSFIAAWNTQPQSETALDTAVIAIAGALNRDVDDMRQAFADFRQQATVESNNEVPGSFVGSREALLFGTVVGDVLGVDHVFAALLSPTGGMVGPGGVSFHVKGGVLGYHGVAHDAGGYLCRRHKVEPGYEYIEDRTGLPCEDSPLAGQVSGIAFWFKVLRLGWRNFLAESNPADLIDPSLESLAPAPGELPAESESSDGVLLNRAERLFLQSLITRESDPADAGWVAEGLKSLQARGFVSGSEEAGYTINDQLVMAMAVYLEPQIMVEASPAALESAGAAEPVKYYQWGDYYVEQTSPGPDVIRLAGLENAAHATERLGEIMPLDAGELEALTLSMSEEAFETAVAAAEAGTFDPGASIPFESMAGPATESAADLAQSLGAGQRAGSMRIQRFDGRKPAGTRNVQFLQGSRGTWLVIRDSEIAGQVEITLATPEALEGAR